MVMQGVTNWRSAVTVPGAGRGLSVAALPDWRVVIEAEEVMGQAERPARTPAGRHPVAL